MINEQAVLSLAQYNMGLQPGESLLVLTDVPNLGQWEGEEAPLSSILARAGLARRVHAILREKLPANEIVLAAYSSTGINGTEPPDPVPALLRRHSATLMMTSYSLSHTDSREAACLEGRRVASMPGIEAAMFAPDGPMSADYAEVARESTRLAAVLTQAVHARVETDAGTALTFSLKGRAGYADTGVFTAPGAWGNLPGGEAFAAPLEGTAQGVLVAPAGWYPDLREDMALYFAGGAVVRVEGGGLVGDYFRDVLFSPHSPAHRRGCAELGIGTNPLARRPDNVLEAEKIKGTVHIAIGDNAHMGGDTPSDMHEDFVLPKPRLYLDGALIPLE